MATPVLTPLAAETLAALRSLMRCYEQHPCQGFTTDDIKFRMGRPFIDLTDAIDELERTKQIRFTGFDDTCAVSACSCYVPLGDSSLPPKRE